MKNRRVLALAGCIGFLTLAAGCTPAAREDVGKAGDNLSSATQKSAEGTAEAVNKAGDKVADATKNAAQDVQRGAAKAGEEVKQGAEAVGDATKNAAQDVQRGAAKAAEAVGDATATVALTPKVRNAIVAGSKENITDLNVDTKNDSKTVVVMGTAPSAAVKTQAIADAKKALSDAKSDYKLVDQLKVGAAK